MEEILEECKSIVDEVCEKYGYDRDDTEKYDSLRTVLLKALPAMLIDAKQEDRELFYQMLKHTPIVVTENLTQEGLDKLKETYIGNVNPHIQEEEQDLGEYGKGVAAGSYISEPIIGEDMQIKGKKSFLYVQKLNLNYEAKEFLGTDINVSHLIHELGHAWHAEKDQYTMTEDGILIERIGTAQFKYSFSPMEDGKLIRKNENVTGLFIEEGMNTIEEEKAMANYMGISLEEMKKAYDGVLIKSSYQGLTRNLVQDLSDKTYKSDLESWRLHADDSSKKRVEDLILQTEEWKNKDEMVLADYAQKRKIMSQIDNPKVQDFFQKYESVYFPDISDITPLQRIDNTLEQLYNLKDIRYNMDISAYSELIHQIAYEFYPSINQAEEIKAKEEIARIIENVRSTEVEEVTYETKEGVKMQEGEKIQEGEENEK